MNKIIINSVKSIAKRVYSPKYLIITNSMTGIISMCIGDSIQQRIEFNLDSNQNKQQISEQKEFEFNKKRNR